MKNKFDLLITNVTVVTLDDASAVLKNAYVAVSGGKIVRVETGKPEIPDGCTVIDGKKGVLMPGLINGHTHLPMTALRGYSDDTDLHTWLNDFIFPKEDLFDAETATIATKIGLMEALMFGTVSLSDMYFFCDEIAKACADAKIKANISRGAHLFTEDFNPLEHKAMVDQNRLLNDWNEYDSGLIKIDTAIHAEYTTNYKMWEYVSDLAAKWNTGTHIHLSETKSEHDGCISRYGLTPTQILDKHGMFGNRVIAAHGVYLTDEDISILKERNASVILCPVSNLKLASGIADGKKLLEQEINLAIGTDGVSSNNNADLFEEIKLAAILQKERAMDPKCFTAEEVLRMATRNGAKSQRRENETGMIAAGYDADLILLDYDKPHLYPCHDIVRSIVYSAKGSDVRMTMVRGNVLYKDGEFTTIDFEKTKYELEHVLMPRMFG